MSFIEFLKESKIGNGAKLTPQKRVDVPRANQREEGAVAFQLIRYELPNGTRGEFDTKILPNGKQIVHNGDGIFKDGTVINLKDYDLNESLTVREVRHLLFNINSKEADELRRELFDIADQESKAPKEVLDRFNKIKKKNK